MKLHNLKPFKKILSRKFKVGSSRIRINEESLEFLRGKLKGTGSESKDKTSLSALFRSELSPDLFGLKGELSKPEVIKRLRKNDKDRWMERIRKLRRYLKINRSNFVPEEVRKIYLKIKGNKIDSVKKLKGYEKKKE